MENESCGITVFNLIKWDDFTKLTKSEAAELSEAEKSGFVNANDIDRSNIGV